MKQSESISKLLSGLMDVQREIPTMPKNAKVSYKLTHYCYTDLDTITSVIKPILARHDIAYMQSVETNEQGQNILTTRIFNRDGEFVESSTILPIIQGANSAQALGMSITYMRRYSLCAMFGITSDEDVDANTFNAPQPQQTQAPQNVQNVANAMNGTVTETRNIGLEIKNLLESVDANGMAIFTEADKNRFRAEFGKKELSAILSDVQIEITKRRNAR